MLPAVARTGTRARPSPGPRPALTVLPRGLCPAWDELGGSLWPTLGPRPQSLTPSHTGPVGLLYASRRVLETPDLLRVQRWALGDPFARAWLHHLLQASGLGDMGEPGFLPRVGPMGKAPSPPIRQKHVVPQCSFGKDLGTPG